MRLSKLRHLHRASKQTRQFKVAIFDFDGTLFDTEPYATQCVIEAMQIQGITSMPIDKQLDLQQYCLGRSLNDIFQYIASSLQIDVDQLTSDYRDIWRNNLNHDHAIEDSIEHVKQLALQDIALCICTGSERDQVTPLLDRTGITDIFKHIICADDYQVGLGKPHPHPYLLTLQHAGIDAQDAVVYEDSISGVKSAKAANIGYIIAIGSHDRQTDLLSAGADMVVESLQPTKIYR